MITTKHVPLIVGPRGATIKKIEQRCKIRLQIQKREEELNRAFGSGSERNKKAVNGSEDTVFFLFGEEHGRSMAKKMIEEVS